MTPPPSVIAVVLSIVPVAGAASAQTLADAATHAQPQHYMITLPPTPVAEVAEVVLGQSLGLPFKVDADVEAEMTFKVDGVFGPQELAREFGYRLWNVDVALIERPSDGLWLIPEAELPAALAAGAVVVSPLAATPARAPAVSTAPKVALDRVGPSDSSGWAWLVWLLGGWAAGVGSVLGWLRQRRPARPTKVPLLAAPKFEGDPNWTEPEPDDGLVIPSFEKIDSSLAATAGRSET